MKYQVLINFNDENYALDVADSQDKFQKTTIRELKEKFRYKTPEAPDPEYFRVIYGKVPLEADRTLAFDQITHLSLLFFVSRSTGGVVRQFINYSLDINLSGLTNQGTTCYLNTVVQVLFRTDRFRDSVLRFRENLTGSPEDKLLQALARVFRQLQHGHTAVSLEEIIEALNIRDVNEQKDAAECLQIILHRLTEQAKIFCGILKTSIICSTCKWKHECKKEFLSIPMSIIAAGHCDTENAFNHYLAVHVMSGDNQLFCLQCKSKRDMEMRNDIITWPDVLTLQLKRFEMRYTRRLYLENEHRVKIPPSIQTGLVNYELYSVINHYGSSMGGHYDAVIKDQRGNWNQFNDRDVTELGYSGHQWISDRSSSAYLLMYRGVSSLLTSSSLPALTSSSPRSAPREPRWIFCCPSASLRPPTAGLVPVSSLQMFKERLKEEFQFLNEENSPAERKLLNEVFIEQLITEEPDSHISDKREIKCRNMFQCKKIRTVLMKGDAGTGKTVTVQKRILDWAEEKSHHDIKYIFPISFQKLNIINVMMKQCSFMQLLERCFKHIEDFSPESDNIMLIFDGLNEFKCALDFRRPKKITDINEPASVSDILTNLIMGNLLPHAQVLITSRPAAAQQIPDKYIDRVTEIHGFNDEQKEEYFRKNISNQRMCDAIFRLIKSSTQVNSMCYSPDYCRIIAAIPERMIKTRLDDFPKTLTQMYSKLLLDQIEGIKKKERDIVMPLGKLAFHRLVNGGNLFSDDDLKEFEIRDKSVPSSIIKNIEDRSNHRYFSFVNHRTQEFLAALYVTDVINGRKDPKPKHRLSLKLNFREESFTNSIVLQKVMKRSLETQMDLFFCFWLDLMLESSQGALKDLLTEKSSSSFNQNTIERIKNLIMSSSPDSADGFGLVSDAHVIQEKKTQLSLGPTLSPDQFLELMIELLNSEEQQKLTPLVKSSRQHEDFQSAAGEDICAGKDIRGSVADPVWNPRSSIFQITDSGCADQSVNLRSRPSRRREMDLSGNEIKHSGVKELSDLLNQSQCKLQELEAMLQNIQDAVLRLHNTT